MDLGGRPQKLELAAPDGLLTVHPAIDETALHGNLVRPNGIEHLVLPWTSRHILLAGTSPITAVVAARDLARDIGVGEGATVPAIAIGRRLSVRAAMVRVARVDRLRWHLVVADGSALTTIVMDEAGTPTNLDDGREWPLELGLPG